jgi:hypothetical protein
LGRKRGLRIHYPATCDICLKTIEAPEHFYICGECGRTVCTECAWPSWLGVCNDCLEVYQQEEDYWGWM